MILKALGGGYRVRWREHGDLRQKTCSTNEEARRLNARKVLKHRGGQRRRPVEPLNIEVKDFAPQWLERKRLDVQPKTFASYQETVKRYILKEGIGIGALRVRDVEREDIEALLKQAATKSTKGHLSKDTLRIIRATCSLLFKGAIKAKLIDTNPCADLDLKLGTLSQADRQRSIRPMTYAQLARFLRAAKQHAVRRDYTVFLTLAETGMRPSEALALQWQDLDTDERALRIERAVTLGGQIKRTKTGTERTVRLTVPLAEALTAWRQHRERVSAKAKTPPSEYVFPSRTGQPLDAKMISRRFRGLLRRAGLPHFRLYDLRHTLASQLLDQGVPFTVVAKQLGHAKPTTTLSFYSHWLPQDDTPYLDRLTAARQAAGDLNGGFVRTKPGRNARNA
jgi:integrase